MAGCGGGGSPYAQSVTGNGPTNLPVEKTFTLTGGGASGGAPGGTATLGVSIQLVDAKLASQGRSVTSITLSVTGLPDSITATFSENPVIPTDSPKPINISMPIPSDALDGTYALTVVATANDGTVRTVPSTLEIKTPEPPVNPIVSLTGPVPPEMEAGQSIQLPLSANVIQGSMEGATFNLRAVGLPEGFEPSFAPTSVRITNGAAESTFTLKAPANAVPGTYSFSIELFTDTGFIYSRLSFPDQLIIR